MSSSFQPCTTEGFCTGQLGPFDNYLSSCQLNAGDTLIIWLKGVSNNYIRPVVTDFPQANLLWMGQDQTGIRPGQNYVNVEMSTGSSSGPQGTFLHSIAYVYEIRLTVEYTLHG